MSMRRGGEGPTLAHDGFAISPCIRAAAAVSRVTGCRFVASKLALTTLLVLINWVARALEGSGAQAGGSKWQRTRPSARRPNGRCSGLSGRLQPLNPMGTTRKQEQTASPLGKLVRDRSGLALQSMRRPSPSQSLDVSRKRPLRQMTQGRFTTSNGWPRICAGSLRQRTCASLNSSASRQKSSIASTGCSTPLRALWRRPIRHHAGAAVLRDPAGGPLGLRQGRIVGAGSSSSPLNAPTGPFMNYDPHAERRFGEQKLPIANAGSRTNASSAQSVRDVKTTRVARLSRPQRGTRRDRTSGAAPNLVQNRRNIAFEQLRILGHWKMTEPSHFHDLCTRNMFSCCARIGWRT